MRLPNSVIRGAKEAGIHVYFTDRNTTRVWNKSRQTGEPLQYGGWYWTRTERGRVVETDSEGPFRSESAAIRDAFVKLQIRKRA